MSRDAELTRKRDGATATREYDRQKTESGWTASGSATNFRGQTRGFEAMHSRGNGSAQTSGSYSTFRGQSYTFSGSRQKSGTGYVANQNIQNSSGATVYNRDVSVTRANGQVNRSVDVTRAQGFRPPRPHHARAKHGRRR